MFRECQRKQPFLVSALINNTNLANAMIDTSCLVYGLCDPRFARKNRLQRIKIRPIELLTFEGSPARNRIEEVAVIELDLDSHKSKEWVYVCLIGDHDIILGMPWLCKREVLIDAT